MKTNLYVLSIIIVSYTFISCSSNGDKSVLEPLSSKEQEELVQKDGYLAMAVAIPDKIKIDELPRSKCEDLKELTYKRLNNFLIMMANPDETLKQNFEKEWDEKYAPKLKEIERISLDYKQKFEDAKPERLVKAEWISINDATDAYMGVANITFRLTPLQGEVQTFEAHFGITLKGNGVFFSYLETTGRNRINVENSFSSPIEIQQYITFNTSDIDPKDFEDLSPTQLQEKYNFQISINKVEKDNQCHSYITAFNIVPSYIQSLWKHEEEDDWEEWKEIYLVSAAESHFEIEIDKKSVYVNKRIREHQYKMDPIAAWLVYEYTLKLN